MNINWPSEWITTEHRMFLAALSAHARSATLLTGGPGIELVIS
jgi:hypothetical protein